MRDRKPKAFSIKFADAPPKGSSIWLKGDEFVLTLVEPYTRRDGGKTNLLTWSSSCKCCLETFTQTTGRSFSSLRKNCDDCLVERKAGCGKIRS